MSNDSCRFSSYVIALESSSSNICKILCRHVHRLYTYLPISASFMQIFYRYVDRQFTYLQKICKSMQIFYRYLTDNLHICKISAKCMQIFCRYPRSCCSYAAELPHICDRYLQTFCRYVSLVIYIAVKLNTRLTAMLLAVNSCKGRINFIMY